MYLIRFIILWLLLTVIAWFHANAQLVINEYQCSNLSTVTDNYGLYEDWFELYNSSSSTINLAGYYLSDKASNPTKWQFSSGSISAYGFVRIWCSGRDEISGSYYHTNFKLTQTKPEVIMVSDPSAIIIDSFTLRINKPGHSWGRVSDGSADWGIFTNPTSGTSNNGQTNYTRYANRPSYSSAGGFYTGPISITLSTNEPGATIYYTIDGSEPTTSSSAYINPISVSTTTVIKSFTQPTDPTVLPSLYEFNTYFIDVSHTMPVVSLAGKDIDDLLNGNSWLQPVTSIEYYEEDQSFKFKTVGVCDKHGNDSWAYNQRGIDYIAWDQYGYNHYMEYKIFPRTDRDEFQRVIFKAGASDNYPGSGWLQSCHMRDAFVHDYSEKIGLEIEGRRVNHCIIYVNGEYWGVYETREKMDDADYTDYYFNQGERDLDLMKFWGGLQVDYGSDTGWVDLYNYIMANSMTNQTAYDYVKARLSFKNFIDYCIYNTYIVNTDWINWNTMWWRGINPNGDKKKWNYALWDEDNTFNLGQNYSGWQTTGATADPCDLANNFQNAGPNMGTMDVLQALLNNPEFHQDYIVRYTDLMNGKLSCDSVLEHLQWFEDRLLPEMQGQVDRWGGSVSDWQDNVDLIRDFLNDRCDYIAGSITGCYDVSGPYTLTVIVDPPGAGKVQINSFTPPGYPYTGNYFGDVMTHLKSIENPDYIFGYWIPGVNALTGNNILSDTVSMEMTANDTIIAHFKYWPDSVVINSVNDAGDLHIAVFPSVTNDQLIIEFKGLPEPMNACRIKSITGQTVADLSKEVNGLVEGRKVLSLRNLGLAQGMYFVEFTAGQHKQTSKIVYQVD